ncbi:MAG TPA: 3-deoxy-manno-octulosonate cytidylyltransferase [Rhodospirillaceae bacterium]|nr:3-deoxy-manno-octulosonate cytidylyltransferase [Rhodospirillaceae bacterium]
MKIAIAIPARYGSSRFPGKPLAKIGGRTMLERVAAIAKAATVDIKNATVFITTEDRRIESHAKEIGVPCIMTPASCATGSDRVLSALRQLDEWPDFIVNLQGDAPFTPPAVIKTLIKAFIEKDRPEVVTPVHQLSWEDLDRLREAKKKTPFSGTTAVINKEGRALWFSKNILPAIRAEETLREKGDKSPVYQHMGLYGFRSDILEKFCELPQSPYEKLEGLEQLRMLENGIQIQAVKVKIPSGLIRSGIDAPEDIKRAEKMLAAYGDQFP